MKQGDQLPAPEEQRKRVEIELAAIEGSAAFVRSPVMRRLLRFIVGESEAGRGALIKSYTVAVDGLGRGEDFDAQQDSYPRVQIGRLRKALESYYRHNASVSGVRFDLRPGSYEIHFVETGVIVPPALPSTASRWLQGHWPGLRARPLDYLGVISVIVVFCILVALLVTTGTGKRLLAPWDLTDAESANAVADFPILEVRPVISVEPDAELAEILTFQVTNAIRRTGWVRVRSSVPVPDGRLPSAPDYQLRSRLFRQGDDFILSAELVASGQDLVVWTGNMPIGPIVAGIAADMGPMLTRLTSTIAGPRGIIADRTLPKDVAAGVPPGYPCLVRTFECRRLRNIDGYGAVRNCLERTLEASPRFAKAWSLLAMLHQEGLDFGFEAVAVDDPATVLRMANRAVLLDPDDAYALSNLAYLQYRNGDYARARANAWRSYSLNPYSSEQSIRLGNTLFFMGDRRGLDIVRTGLEADPSPAPWYRHALFFDAVARGDTSSAVVVAEAMPDMPGQGGLFLLIIRAIASAMRGDTEAARKYWSIVDRAAPQGKGDVSYMLVRMGVSKPYADISANVLRKAGVLL